MLKFRMHYYQNKKIHSDIQCIFSSLNNNTDYESKRLTKDQSVILYRHLPKQ
jgi:hypothetical protein